MHLLQKIVINSSFLNGNNNNNTSNFKVTIKHSKKEINMLIMLQPLFVFLFFSSFLYLYFKTPSTKKPTTHGLKCYPVIGHLPHFFQNGHRFLDWVTELLLQSPTRTIGFCSIGTRPSIITANPANLEYIYKLNSSNYPKGEKMISAMEDFLGHGIFNSDGEDWYRKRKTASFELNRKSLRNFLVEIVHFEIVNRLLPILNRASEKGSEVDLQDVFLRFTFDNICKYIIGEDPACLTEEDNEAVDGTSSSKEFMVALSAIQDITSARFEEMIEDLWKIKKFFNIGSENRLKKALAIVEAKMKTIIGSRMLKGMDLDGREDILSRFASNKDHNEVELRDAVTNFLSAGRDSVSSGLIWFFWLVSTRPDIEKKILDEIKLVRTTNNITTETLSFDIIREMNYLHAAITESMRLSSPIPFNTVLCQEDDVMPDGTFVGKGWFVSYSSYVMGRSEDIWGKDCLDFKPERWLDENGVFRPDSPFRYPIFHAGPRTCLGKEIAYIQIKITAAFVFERFKLTVMGKKGTPEHISSLTLRMKGGLLVQPKNRENE